MFGRDVALLSKLGESHWQAWSSFGTCISVEHEASGNVKDLNEALRQLDKRSLQVSDPIDTYASLLRRCSRARALTDGRHVHAHIVKSGYAQHAILGDLLVQMYGKCGSPEDAWAVFQGLSRRNVFSWNFIIGAYARSGHAKKALQLLENMESDGVQPDHVTFLYVLGACSSLRALGRGMAIHASIAFHGFRSHVAVQNALISMYARCGNLNLARDVFNKMQHKDVVSWNAIIAAYCHEGRAKEALDLYHAMIPKGVQPDCVTFASILAVCSNLEEGRAVHARIVVRGFQSRIVIQNALVSMYARCGNLHEAKQVFDSIQHKDAISWNAMIVACSQCTDGTEAIELYKRMNLEGMRPDSVTFASVIRACSTMERGLKEAKAIEPCILSSELESHVVVQSARVHMYAKCGKLDAAKVVFDRIQQKNVVSWNSMIGAYMRCGKAKEALDLFERMSLESTQPDEITYVTVLGACSNLKDLAKGRDIHMHIVTSGLKSSVVVETALINMYAKCGMLSAARLVFNRVERKNVVCWNAIIAAYLQLDHGLEALRCYVSMDLDGVQPDSITLTSILGACSRLGALKEGMAIHEQIVTSHLEPRVDVDTALVNMYAKCGRLEVAMGLFDEMQYKNLVSWNTMISACVHHGHGRYALCLLQRMELEGMQPDSITLAAALCACGSSLGTIVKLHERITADGFQSNVVLQNALVSAYARCRSCLGLKLAREVFDGIQDKDVGSWNAMVAGYTQHGDCRAGLELYQSMASQNMVPDDITYVSALSACAGVAALEEGKSIHARLIHTDTVLETALVTMYAQCGDLHAAKEVFDRSHQKNVASWNAMIAGYVQQGHSREALGLYHKMNLEGVQPDGTTFSRVLGACSSLEALADGRAVHERMVACGVSSVAVHNALVTMYAKCGSLDAARLVFENVQVKDYGSWNAIIAACGQHGRGEEALHFEHEMNLNGLQPNDTTFLSILSACSHAGLLQDGRNCFLTMVSEHGVRPMREHYLCMGDLLARSGRLDEAQELIHTSLAYPPECANAFQDGSLGY